MFSYRTQVGWRKKGDERKREREKDIWSSYSLFYNSICAHISLWFVCRIKDFLLSDIHPFYQITQFYVYIKRIFQFHSCWFRSQRVFSIIFSLKSPTLSLDRKWNLSLSSVKKRLVFLLTKLSRFLLAYKAGEMIACTRDPHYLSLSGYREYSVMSMCESIYKNPRIFEPMGESARKYIRYCARLISPNRACAPRARPLTTATCRF